MDKEELKAFVNKLLDKKGFPTVKSFAKEFADGGKYSKPYLFSNLPCLVS